MNIRRQFLKQTALLAGSEVLASVIYNPAFAIFNSIMPNEQINIAVIGANGMGWYNVKAGMSIPGLNLVGICDVDIGNSIVECNRMSAAQSRCDKVVQVG